MKTIITIIFLLFGHFIYSQQIQNNFTMDSIGCLLGKTRLEIYKLYGKPSWITKGIPPIYEFGTNQITEEKIMEYKWLKFNYKKPCNIMTIYFKNGKADKIIFKKEE